MKKRLKIAIGVLITAVGLFIAAASLLLAGPCSPEQLSRVSGAFSGYVSQDQTFRRVVKNHGIRLMDGRVYPVDAGAEASFDAELFIASVLPGDAVELLVRQNADGVPSVLAVYHGGREYMDFEETQSARQTSQTLGAVLGAAVTLAGLAVLLVCVPRR